MSDSGNCVCLLIKVNILYLQALINKNTQFPESLIFNSLFYINNVSDKKSFFKLLVMREFLNFEIPEGPNRKVPYISMKNVNYNMMR